MKFFGKFKPKTWEEKRYYLFLQKFVAFNACNSMTRRSYSSYISDVYGFFDDATPAQGPSRPFGLQKLRIGHELIDGYRRRPRNHKHPQDGGIR
jgi:hypothetical protein